jgi:hypothetical protein
VVHPPRAGATGGAMELLTTFSNALADAIDAVMSKNLIDA